jgi:hypothetical protein
MSEIIEKFFHNEKMLAIVIKGNFSNTGLNFFTPESFPLQLGIHLRKRNEEVAAHRHSHFHNLSQIPAQEFFYVERGQVEVGIYSDDDKLLKKPILNKGDMILLNCGHSITFLEDSKLIEVKQGPYRGKATEKEAINNRKNI